MFNSSESILNSLKNREKSLSYGGLWYLDASLFNSTNIENGKTVYQNALEQLEKEFDRSQEIFIKDQRRRYPGQDADAWRVYDNSLPIKKKNYLCATFNKV